MIQLIKKRFVRVSMLSSGIILFVILSLINVLNYTSTINRMDKLLSVQNIQSAGRYYNSANGATKGNQPSNQQKYLMGNQRSKVFYVEFDNAGNLINYYLDNSPFSSSEDALSLASATLDTGSNKGFIDGFRYSVLNKSNSYTVAFIDGQSDLYTLQYNLIFSLVVYLFSLVGIFIIVKLLTKPAVKPIVESYNKQKRFMTDIMHEIKTPLAIIETDTEVIEIDHGKTEWTRSIRGQIHYLKDLLDELVTLLKMDEHTTDLVKTNVDFSQIIEDQLVGFEPVFNKKGITLDIDCDQDIEIIANEDSIERLVSIVLENALKYTSGKNTVAIKLKKQNKRILFEVENSVDSIKVGTHDEYFDRFFRSDSSRNSTLGGHGIGLSIAKEIVIQSKGSITAFSKDEHTFSISILINYKAKT